MKIISLIRKYEEKALEGKRREEHLQSARLAQKILEFYLRGPVRFWELEVLRHLAAAGEKPPMQLVFYKILEKQDVEVYKK